MNTDGHLTPEERLAYWQRGLAPGDLLAVSDHLEQCEDCRAELLHSQPRRFDSKPVSFEELAAAASGELDPLAQRRITRTPKAAAELEDLKRFRDEMNDLPPHAYSLGEMPTGSRTSWILPIAAGLALGFAFLWWNTSERNATRGLVLRDNGRQIVIRQNGEVPAVGPLPEELQSAVRGAMSLGKASLPPLLAQLRPQAGTLAGSRGSSDHFAALAPIATVVSTAQPIFRWTSEPGATGYRVNLVRRSGGEIVTSPPLGAETTEWTPSQSLQPGELYEWEVEALRADELIAKAPAPPEPEARFAVLSHDQQKELPRLRAQLGRSHLLLGLAFARLGLVPEARAEFQQLVQENPRSELPKTLLASVGPNDR